MTSNYIDEAVDKANLAGFRYAFNLVKLCATFGESVETIIPQLEKALKELEDELSD